MPKYVGDLGKLIVATCYEKLPKFQYIAQSGHTAHGMASLSLRHTLTHSLSFTHKSYCKFFFFSLKLLSKIGGGEVLKKYLKVIFEILLEPKTGKDFKFFCQ